MFGYIVPDKPELKIKEYELFRTYYCGVCKSLGRNLGVLSRFTLNYDTVFLGLLLASLHGENPELRREVCIANPFKRKWVAKKSKYIDFAADINTILTYYKLKDNWNDEKSILSKAAGLALLPGYKKARARNPETDMIVERSIAALAKLEAARCSSIDEAAEPFAVMMKEIMAAGGGACDASTRRILEWIGYNTGKWIYTIDAYDDIEKDIKSGSYNPILLKYSYNGEDICSFKSRIKDEVSRGLIHSLGQLSSSVELLSLNNKGIIDNIIYLGLNKKTGSILDKCPDKCSKDKRSCGKNEKSV